MIIDLQRRLMEIGRLRIGQQVPAGKGTRPAKLDTWRFTSANESVIRKAAELYGGDMRPWEAPSGSQWEVVSKATTLPVLVPPADLAFTQFYETWSGGGCQRRCDGVTESISDQPCLCDPDARECKIHTRLSILLSDLPGLGVWRVETSGFYAATELSAAVHIIGLAAGRGEMLPATLRLEQRMTKRPNQGTRRFAVPVLDIEVSPAQLLGGTPIEHTTPAIEAPTNNGAPLTPVPESVPEWPSSSVAEQIATPKPRRKSTQQPIPKTGVKPRTAAQAAAVLTEPKPADPEPEQVDRSDELAELEQQQAEQTALDPCPCFAERAADDPELITDGQLKLLQIRFRERGFNDNDRAGRIAYTAGVIGHEITSSKDLTKTEASRVIDSLET